MLKRKIALLLCLFLLMCTLMSCQSNYFMTLGDSFFEDIYVKSKSRSFDEEWMIGKTEEEIIDKYGDFDFALDKSMSCHDNCREGALRHYAEYVIHPYISRSLGASYETRLVVKFSCDGVCISTEIKQYV